MLTNREERK